MLLLVIKRWRGDPLENAISAYAGVEAVNCGSFADDQEPDTKAIAGCVAKARKSGKAFRVSRTFIPQQSYSSFVSTERWSTAIAGLPDGSTRIFYIRRERWGGILVRNNYVPDKGFTWKLDMDDVQGHQLKIG